MVRPTTPKLSRERIADAALAVADEQGNFTIAQLAAALEVSQSSLYNHVSGREAVVDLIRQRLHEEMAVRVNTAGTWQQVVRELARGQRDALAKHPWLIQPLAMSPAEPGGAASSVENLATVLARAGFADSEVLRIIASIDVIVIGGSIDRVSPEQLYPRSVVEGTTDLARAVRAAPKTAPRADLTFEFLLDVFIDALESRLPKA